MNLSDFIFLIPARKNSKELKNKNFVKIKGKNLIEYTFMNLDWISSKKKFLISDSFMAKKIAKKYKIDTSYFRPKKLSKDNTDLIANLIDFDRYIKNQEIEFKYYVVLQPTSPLRKKKDLKNALKIFIKEKADSLFSVSKSLEHPSDSFFLNKKFVKYFLKNSSNLRQSYKKSFFINGSIYIFNRALLKSKKIISNNRNSLYLMPKIRSIDINDKEDLEIAKKLI